jgi:hypothetical protein
MNAAEFYYYVCNELAFYSVYVTMHPGIYNDENWKQGIIKANSLDKIFAT